MRDEMFSIESEGFGFDVVVLYPSGYQWTIWEVQARLRCLPAHEWCETDNVLNEIGGFRDRDRDGKGDSSH